ncbi:hypothetical protein CDAR_467181 [Caerostris darwini]|uniref:Uncharacterized protein n=1 Tax=Caerostris darwini TaxID=1538125 RepID=A0AAV4RHL1_9ARAC|nr:hypothetical protein CDAR_467181 [Caerostris darwini]
MLLFKYLLHPGVECLAKNQKVGKVSRQCNLPLQDESLPLCWPRVVRQTAISPFLLITGGISSDIITSPFMTVIYFTKGVRPYFLTPSLLLGLNAERSYKAPTAVI